MHQCTLTIRDMVNVKFDGLDPITRGKLLNAVKFMVPHARHTPQFKLKRWDGKETFGTIGGATYLNLLERVLPIVLDAGYEIDLDDRRPDMAFAFPTITEEFLADRVWPADHPHAGEPIMLRDYQVEAVNRYFANPQSLQCISTGAGKTILCGALSLAVEMTTAGRSIVIVPSKSLVEQTEEDYRNLGLDVGVFYGDRKEWGRQHVISTWQSMSIFSKKTRRDEVDVPIDEFIDGVQCVMVDECFDGATPVLTTKGWRPISEIRIGDTVINWSEQDERFKPDVVVNIHRNLLNSGSEPMLELSMDNGSIIRVTANHRFLTQRGWVRADELSKDDDIREFPTESSSETDI